MLLSADILIINEIYFVDVDAFDSVLACWDRCGRSFSLVMLGDALQPASGRPRCTQHGGWAEMHVLKLRKSHRAADPRFARLLPVSFTRDVQLLCQQCVLNDITSDSLVFFLCKQSRRCWSDGATKRCEGIKLLDSARALSGGSFP